MIQLIFHFLRFYLLFYYSCYNTPLKQINVFLNEFSNLSIFVFFFKWNSLFRRRLLRKFLPFLDCNFGGNTPCLSSGLVGSAWLSLVSLQHSYGFLHLETNQLELIMYHVAYQLWYRIARYSMSQKSVSVILRGYLNFASMISIFSRNYRGFRH